jgi:hypothetical protein
MNRDRRGGEGEEEQESGPNSKRKIRWGASHTKKNTKLKRLRFFLSCKQMFPFLGRSV